jgi:hypothetical protein
MRTRAILPAVSLALAGAAIGCQFIAGIAGLEATEEVGTECEMASDCGASTDCRAFACDNGTCKGVDAESGTPCGGKCAADVSTAPGTCLAGKCSSEEKSCSPYGCNMEGTACRTSCDMEGGCATDGGVCLVADRRCESCGFTPPPMGCMDCASCSGDTCVKTCGSADAGADECNESFVLDTIKAPIRLECKDRCNNLTINCKGAALCEVVCDDSKGCQNMTLICSPDGPCKLTCSGSGCTNSVTVRCGGNTCAVDCNGMDPVLVTQICGDACSCSKGKFCR